VYSTVYTSSFYIRNEKEKKKGHKTRIGRIPTYYFIGVQQVTNLATLNHALVRFAFSVHIIMIFSLSVYTMPYSSYTVRGLLLLFYWPTRSLP
jgi:hypothetical protein